MIDVDFVILIHDLDPIDIWVKVFKNGPSKIYGRQPLKNLTWSILEYLDPMTLQYIQYIQFMQ